MCRLGPSAVLTDALEALSSAVLCEALAKQRQGQQTADAACDQAPVLPGLAELLDATGGGLHLCVPGVWMMAGMGLS